MPQTHHIRVLRVWHHVEVVCEQINETALQLTLEPVELGALRSRKVATRGICAVNEI